jgi:hypothetical protein
MQPFTTNNMTADQGFSGTNWGTPDFWTVNEAGLNVTNSGATAPTGGANYGKSGMANIGELCFQAGWGCAALTNGKYYQTTTLPAGSYQVDIEVQESASNLFNSTNAIYLIVDNGTEIPDLVGGYEAPTALASLAIQKGISYGTKTVQNVTFTLAEQTEVSIGFVVTMTPNCYVRVNYMKLTLLE